MSDQSNQSKIESKILDFFKSKQFSVTDNFPRDYAKENELILNQRASLLIYLAIPTNRFAPFMRSGNHEGSSVCFELKKPIKIHEERSGVTHEFDFNKIVFYTGQYPKVDHFGQSGLCRLKINEEKTTHSELYLAKAYGNFIEFQDGTNIFIDDIIRKAVTEFRKRSIFDYCCDYSPYNTPEKVCRFFDNPCAAYSPIKPESKTLRIDNFHKHSVKKSPEFENLRANKHSSDYSDEDLIQNLLETYVYDIGKSMPLNLAFEKYYGDWFKNVYSFENEHGEVVQKAIKIFDRKIQSKWLIPCTAWTKTGSIQNEHFCVPLPHKQILYNLNLIKAQVSPIIILTDSIEIADNNPPHSLLPGIVWTSWLCDESSFDQVDWTPLQDAQDVYYLITNHSGNNLAQAYVKAHEVAMHLKDKIKNGLKFIQCDVDFKDKKLRHFESIKDIIDYRNNNKPEVVNDSIKVMATFEEFEEIHKKAEEYLSPPRKPFYAADSEQTQTDHTNDPVAKSSNKKLDAIDYLMRPIIDKGAKGGLCLLHAPAGLGKSSFSYSLCASIVSVNNKFILGKWWTVPKGKKDKDDKDDKDDLRKVLYLDFESGKVRSDRRKKTLAEPYFPSEPSKLKKCNDNFIIKDLFGNDIKFLEPPNHSIILNFLKDAEKQGVKDQPVDLIVFDTLTKLVGTEHSETWNMLEPLINKIRDSGTAVLIITHSTTDGKSRGFVYKDDSLTAKIKLSREGEAGASLKDPIEVKIEKATDDPVSIDFKPFHVQFLNKKWRVPELESKDAIKEYGLIIESYIDYSRNAILQMMGIEKSEHSKRMSAYEKKYPETQKKK